MPTLTTCKSCGKEVAKSAKSCPHCGAKLKMGMGLKLIIGLAVIGALFAFVVPSPDKEKAAADRLRDLQNMASLKAEEISPHGELAEMYNLGSDYTDLQRDAKEKELTGKLVEWKLPVYEVDIDDKEKKIYKVQTSGASGAVGTFVHIHAMDDEDERILSGLKTGNVIHFKGKIKGVSMRNIRIDPAILVRNRGSAESVQALTAQQPAKKETPEECYEREYEEIKKESTQQLKASGNHGPYAEQELVPLGMRMALQENCGLNDGSKPSTEEKPVTPEKANDQSKQQSNAKPSFDCAKASTAVEKMICADAELAKLDVELSNIYASRSSQAPDEAKKVMRGSQLDWLKARRNACPDVGCLQKAYAERIEQISAIRF